MQKQLNKIILLLIGMLIISCRTKSPQSLAFETLEHHHDSLRQQGGGSIYQEPTPGLWVVTSIAEAESLNISAQAHNTLIQKMQAVDYQHHFVAIIFQSYGTNMSSEHTIDIVDIIRTNDQITIKTFFDKLREEPLIISPLGTAPYHVISISKGPQKFGKEIQFILEVDGKVEQTTNYFIP